MPSLCHGYLCRSPFCLPLTPFCYTELLFNFPWKPCYAPAHLCHPLLRGFFSCLHVLFKTWMHHRFTEKTIIFCTLVLSYQILFSFLIAFLIAPEYWVDSVTELTTVNPKCLSQVATAAWRIHVIFISYVFISFISYLFHMYFRLSFPLCIIECYLPFLCVLSLPILLSHFKNPHTSTKAYSKIWFTFF